MINLSRNQDLFRLSGRSKPASPKSNQNNRRQKNQLQSHKNNQYSSLRKLRMPPARLVYVPPSPKATSQSFWSAFRIRSDVWQFSWLEIMTSGCFSSPHSLLRVKESSKRETAAESDYVAELETPARSSVSSIRVAGLDVVAVV